MAKISEKSLIFLEILDLPETLSMSDSFGSDEDMTVIIPRKSSSADIFDVWLIYPESGFLDYL